jgi:hypothetical protein
VRGFTLLPMTLALALAIPSAAAAQSPAPTPVVPVPGTGTGGAVFADDAAPAPQAVVPGLNAKRLPDGTAAAPADAPLEVQQAVWAANEIVGKPYRYGGGHSRAFKDTGYDCSGTVSYALNGAGLLDSPLPSGDLMRWGKAGKGGWITVYANGGHAYAVIAGLRLDTSAAGERVSSGKGPRWRSNARRQAGFTVRHPVGF